MRSVSLRRLVAVVLLLSPTALAQTPAAQTPAAEKADTADRFVPALAGIAGKACLDLISTPKQPWQLACYATGTSNRFGAIAPASVQCQGDASYNDRVNACFASFRIKTPYYGYRGPVCMAIVLDVSKSNMPPPNQLSRQIFAREVYPCEGHPAQTPSPDDFKPGSGPPPKSNAKFELKWDRCNPASARRGASASCLARSAVDASGRPTGQIKSTCSDASFQADAEACLRTAKLKSDYKASVPTEICLRIEFPGEEKKAKEPPSMIKPSTPPIESARPKLIYSYPVGISELKACPDSLFAD